MKFGFLAALGLLFIALKLTGYIAWSWWLVLMPIYLVPALFIVPAVFLYIVVLIAKLFHNHEKKNRPYK